MGFNHDDVGYGSALDLANAFRADKRWHVLGFPDFCRHNGLIDAIRDHKWIAFGAGYKMVTGLPMAPAAGGFRQKGGAPRTAQAF